MLAASRTNDNKVEEVLSLISLHEYTAFHLRDNQKALELLIQAINIADARAIKHLQLHARSKLIYFYQTTIQDQELAYEALTEMKKIHESEQSEFYLMVINQWEAQIIGTKYIIGQAVSQTQIEKSVSTLGETIGYFKTNNKNKLFYYQQALRCMIGFYPSYIGYETGIEYLQIIRSLESQQKDPITKISNLVFEGTFYTHFKKYQLLIDRFMEEKQFLRQSNYGLSKFYYQLLAEAYSKTGDYKNALDATIKLNGFDKQVNSVAFANKIDAIQLKNESAKVEGQNKLLKVRGSYLVFGLLIVLLGLGLALLAYMKVYRQNIIIQQQKDSLKEINLMKNNLFSILSHDLRDPIVSLNNVAQKIKYLSEKGELERLEEMTDEINERTGYLESLLKNILPWMAQQMKSSTINMHPVALTTIVHQVVEEGSLKIDSKEIKVTLDLLINHQVMSNHAALITVLRNILGNAIKYSLRKGYIDISSQKIRNNQVLLTISDKGVGMSQKTTNEIFDTIKSSQGTEGEKGLGIGLKLSKDLMISMGGEITIKSEVKGGTSVTLRLQAA